MVGSQAGKQARPFVAGETQTKDDAMSAQLEEFRFEARRPIGLACQTGSALILEEFLPYRLSVLTSTVSRALARMYEQRFGLTVAEWRIMAILARFGPLS